MSIVIKGIASYPNLFKARPVKSDPNGKPRYGIAILIDKNSERGQQDITAINEAIKGAVEERYGNKPPKKLPLPIEDSDEFEGYAVIRCYSGEEYPPVVMTPQGTPITDKSLVYGGVIVHAEINLYVPKSYDRVSAAVNKVFVTAKVGALGSFSSQTNTDKVLAGITFDEDELAPMPQGNPAASVEDDEDDDTPSGFNV